GYVVYSNQAKEALLGVDPKLLKAKGAVSPEVAEALARQCRLAAGTDLALATTGIAGPTGGSPEKPVGLVYIALADEQATQVFKFQLFGNRENIKFRASQAALELVRRHCLGLALGDGTEA
ncbi:MAG TPA: CinA family protein, partial [bacterium]|nr:CinA family protein [bacterium]